MGVLTILIRNLVGLILLLGGIYLSISSIIALPLLEDEASYKKEDFYAMNVDVDTQRNQSIRFIKDMTLDSSTLVKYDSVSVLLGSQKRSENIKIQVNKSKVLLINNLVDQAEKCKRLYNSVRVLGKIRKENYATQLLLDYAEICALSKQQAFNIIQAVDLQTANLFSIALYDKSPGRAQTSKEKRSLNNIFSLQLVRLPEQKKQDDSTTKFFFPADWSLTERSQNLAIITGLLGFALFGSVIGAFGKINFKTLADDDKLTEGGIYYDIIVYLVKGFSAALVAYLSIKGGLSLITTNNTDKVNPYLILFLCFISAVFSDNIWEWAKTKLVTGSSVNPNDPAKNPKEVTEEADQDDQNADRNDDAQSPGNTGIERPAELPVNALPDQTPALNNPYGLTVTVVPVEIVNAAIAQKIGEWKAVFGIREARLGSIIQPDQSKLNAIVFIINQQQGSDKAYLDEVPPVVTFEAADGETYRIPINLVVTNKR